MSEYQYYEWQTLDRPLTPEEQAQVHRLSSHIEVTSTRAWVEYHWSGFKHDPKQVLARYFDTFMYFANWGSQRLAFRFPKGLLDETALQPYLWEYCVELESVGDYLILDISFPDEDGGAWFEAQGNLSGLARLRDDILQGDYRALYLAWLLAAECSDAADEELEPPVPAGLGELSPALAEFCRFFYLDEHLVQVAAEASLPLRPAPDLRLEEAISRLAPGERDAFLLRLAQREPHLSLVLNRRLQQLVEAPKQPVAQSRRTWGELSARAQALSEEAERRAREAAEAKRIADLEAFAPNAARAWRDVEALIEKKQARPYDEAVALLVRLRDLAVHQDKVPEFQARLSVLQERYAKRPAFQERLQKAGLV